MTLFQSFRDYLSRKYPSIQISVTPDTSISFSINNLNYKYIYHSQEPNYFRLVLPRVGVGDGVSLEAISKIACEVSAGYKVGKIVIVNDEYWICYEQIIINPEGNNDLVYDMSIRVLSTMIQVFRERIQVNNPQ